MARRIAVVLFNLGGPDGLAAVRPFLFNLFRDPAIIGAPGAVRLPLAALISGLRARSARANYAHMGGASPLLAETRAQADALGTALAAALPNDEVRVFIAMSYWKPFVREAARLVEAYAPDEVLLLPLYPQFSGTTTGSSLKAWREAYKGSGETHTVCCYHGEAGFIRAHANRIRAAWEEAGSPEGLRLLFSAHGLPERCISAGDPYQWQVERTCAAVAAELGPGWDWKICYQSRVGPVRWLGPTTPHAIAEACQEGLGVIVTPIAFVSEHIETLVELDRDYAELAEKAGCHTYLRVPALGIEPAFIDGLAKTALKSLGRAGTLPEGEACSGRWRLCPLIAGQTRAAA